MTTLTNLSEIEDDLTSIIDLNLLKWQLIHQRKKLFSQSHLLIKTELSYGDCLLRSNYDDLLNNHRQLNGEYHLLKEEYRNLGHACLYLINKTRDLIDERNQYYNEWERNKSFLTPRPDWDKVPSVIDGGIERWKSLSTGKSSEQLVDILMREIVNGNEIDTMKEQEYFQAMGDDVSVLPFLRMTKYTRIVNRKMRRRMTGLLIKEIWTDKIKKPFDSLIRNLTQIKEQTSPLFPSDINSNEPQKTFADHVALYFEKRFASKTIAIEMGYNLRDACQRYHNSEQINLFWGILTGQIEEMVYHHQMKSISQLLQHLMKMKTYFSYQHQSSSSSSLPKARKAIVSEPNSPLSVIANHRLSSLSLFSIQGYQAATVSPDNLILTAEQFIESLKLLYPNKTSSQLDDLYLSAKRDLHYPNQSIEFSLLFLEDDEGRFGDFLSTFIKQFHQDKIAYVEEIKQILLGYPLITISQFCRAVYMVDPNIHLNELHRYIQWVFSMRNFPSSQQIKPLDLEDLLRRLENCACFKH